MPRRPNAAACACLIAASVLAGAACGGATPIDRASGRLAVSVASLELPGIENACYRITVDNGLTETVWQKAGICAERYGNQGGAISYVGPCDAGAPANTVRLEIEELFDADGPVDRDSYQNPCGHADNGNHDGFAACELPVTCMENADVAVTFDLVIMRRAVQGFFDIAVNFEDIFCSAKVDCKDELLHVSDGGPRGTTVVVAFACTSGLDEPTTLHMTDIAVVCGGAYTWLDPHVGPGQVGQQSDSVWELATYRGQESLPGLDKCYWNLAIGLDVGPDGHAQDCRLVGQGTASTSGFSEDRHTPANTTYPYVDFDVQLTDSSAAFICGEHPLNVTGSGVSTKYTAPTGKDFPWQWECGVDLPITEGRILCDGQSGAEAGSFVDTPAGLVFAHGPAKSPIYQLPTGVKLKSCCGNPCPGCQ